MRLSRALGALLVAAVPVAVGELAHLLASRSLLARSPAASGETVAVLVLGYPSTRTGRVHPLQRWRVRIALRSHPDGLLVFSGGSRLGGRSEASVMADLARAYGVDERRIVVEEHSRTTWDNVANSLPWLAGADVILIASNSLHARRARAYLREQRPDLARRLARAADYRPLEGWALKPLLTAYELGVRIGFGSRPAHRHRPPPR